MRADCFRMHRITHLDVARVDAFKLRGYVSHLLGPPPVRVPSSLPYPTRTLLTYVSYSL